MASKVTFTSSPISSFLSASSAKNSFLAIIGSDFKSLKNVFLLPHMGSSTLEGRIEMGEKVIINIKTFIDGHRPPDQIVPSML